MRKRRYQYDDGKENGDRWLLSYADFITLLFAFFTVMYALSSMSEVKYKALSESLSTAFSVERETKAGDGEYLRGSEGEGPITTTFKKIFSEDFRTIQGGLSELESDEKLKLNLEARGVVVSIMERNVFKSGSADILPESYALLDDLADTLVDMPNAVKIEGHTDNVPISTKAFPSNWELSSKRALNILQYLVDEHGLDPGNISATGYAEFRPVASNDTPEERGKNRRVDIVILNKEGNMIEPMLTGELKERFPAASAVSK